MISDTSSVNFVTFVVVTKLSQIKNSRCVGGTSYLYGSAGREINDGLVVVERREMLTELRCGNFLENVQACERNGR